MASLNLSNTRTFDIGCSECRDDLWPMWMTRYGRQAGLQARGWPITTCPSCGGKTSGVKGQGGGGGGGKGKGDRQKRLTSNIQTLYHQTDEAGMKGISNSMKFERGSTGLAGGGIYFATSKKNTHHKALAKGMRSPLFHSRIHRDELLHSVGSRPRCFFKPYSTEHTTFFT